MVFPPPHLEQESLEGTGAACSMMGEETVHKEGHQRCMLAPWQSTRPAGGRGVYPDGVGEIGSDGHSKHNAVSVPWCAAHDPLTH